MKLREFKLGSESIVLGGIEIGVSKASSFVGSRVYGMCGAGMNCRGGGGQCGAGMNCAGGGGMCGAGMNCAGGGGQCGAGMNCGGQ